MKHDENTTRILKELRQITGLSDMLVEHALSKALADRATHTENVESYEHGVSDALLLLRREIMSA